MPISHSVLTAKQGTKATSSSFMSGPNNSLMHRDKYFVDEEQEAVITEYIYETVDTGGMRIWRGKVKIKLVKDIKGGEVNAFIPGAVTAGPKFLFAPPIGTQVLVHPYISSRTNSIYIINNYYPISFMGSRSDREANSSFLANNMVNLSPGEFYLSAGGDREKSFIKLDKEGGITLSGKENQTSYKIGRFSVGSFPNEIKIQETVNDSYKRYIDSRGNKIEEGNNTKIKFSNQEITTDLLMKVVSETLKLFIEQEVSIKANKIGVSSENYIQMRCRKLIKNIQEQYNTSCQSMNHKVSGDVDLSSGGAVNIAAGGEIHLGEGGDKILRLKDVKNMQFKCPFAGLLTMGALIQNNIGSESCFAKD